MKIYSKLVLTKVLICIVLVLGACVRQDSSNCNTSKEDNEYAEAVFLEKKHKIPSMAIDSLISLRYRLVNTSQNPLHIINVNPDCVCTDKHVSDSVIMPLDTGFIDLEFSSHGKLGFNKINALIKLNTKRKYYKVSAEINVVE